MRRVLLGLLLGLPFLGQSGCFNYDEPPCAYACDPQAANACPDDYECRQDGYCHLVGSTEACTFSDAAIVPDQSVAVDMSMPNADAAADL